MELSGTYEELDSYLQEQFGLLVSLLASFRSWPPESIRRRELYPHQFIGDREGSSCGREYRVAGNHTLITSRD